FKSFDVFLKAGGVNQGITVTPEHGGGEEMIDAIRDQLLEFSKHVRGEDSKIADASVALKSVGVIDECTARRRWPKSVGLGAEGRRAVVTGAGGFIGTRLVEMLLAQDARVLALAHRPQTCIRLVRSDVPVELANVCDERRMNEVLAGGGDVLYHCAVGALDREDVRNTIVRGTMNVLRCAEGAGFRRVVVFSSMLALGNPKADGDVKDHDAPNASDFDYANAKREMEAQCKRFAKQSRLEVVILRPTCVFGPFGKDFGSAHLDRQSSGEFFLLEGGRGLANLVYVDNLAEAAILAGTARCESGSTFIINEEEWPCTWAEFFLPLIRLAFGAGTVIPDLSREELTALAKEHRRRRSFPEVLRQAVRNYPACGEWLGDSRLFQLWRQRQIFLRSNEGTSTETVRSEGAIDGGSNSLKHQLREKVLRLRHFPYGGFYTSFFDSQAVYRSDVARATLGWRPSVDRVAAMNATLEWVERAYPLGDPKGVDVCSRL
ncbi:MAG: NAD(P)-dependent oxidoreductase, partial [Arenicellales bacterium]